MCNRAAPALWEDGAMYILLLQYPASRTTYVRPDPVPVRGFNNTLGCPCTCWGRDRARRFETREDAAEWGERYLTGHNWSVEPL